MVAVDLEACWPIVDREVMIGEVSEGYLSARVQVTVMDEGIYR